MQQTIETYNNNGAVILTEIIEVSDTIVLAGINRARQEAYQNESDPLMAKYLRDEVSKQVWLDKVAEIKLRYPKP